MGQGGEGAGGRAGRSRSPVRRRRGRRGLLRAEDRYQGHGCDPPRGAGFRVHLDEQAGDLRTRIKEAQQRKASYMLVVGDKEAAARTVSVRRRGAAQGEEERGVKLDELIARLTNERDTKMLPPDFGPRGPSV